MVRADFSTDCLGARGAAAKVAKLGGRKRAEVREAAAARRFADRCAMHAASAYHASELRASEADWCPGIPLPLRCDCYATVRRDLIARWTSSTPTELAFLTQPARCEEEVLSGSGYRLRTTGAIGEYTGDRRPLPKFGIPLAEACSAGTSDGWCARPRQRSHGSIG